MAKDPDVKDHYDIVPDAQDTVAVRNQELEEETKSQKKIIDSLAERLARLEYVAGNANKMRKYDEANNPDALKKLGHIPSMDRKDPVIFIGRKGNVWQDENEREHDEQVWTIRTATGTERILSTKEFKAVLEGNSIKCIVNDWDEVMRKTRELDDKRQRLQRATGKHSQLDTVALYNEIKSLEDSITINVTLSLDNGMSYTGMTIDVPFQTIFNAMS